MKIDDLVDADGATYIKMNIEGCELQALRGAQRVIRESHPKLAIAGYHKTWDLWEVPKLIYSIDDSLLPCIASRISSGRLNTQ